MLLVLLFEPTVSSIMTFVPVIILFWCLHEAVFMIGTFDASGTCESGVRADWFSG